MSSDPPSKKGKSKAATKNKKQKTKKMASSLRLAGLGAKMDPPALVIDYTERTTGVLAMAAK